MLVTNNHGRFISTASQGRLYHGSVPIAGFTATAAAPGTPMMALWNPPGSGKYLSIIYIDPWVVSGTAAGVLGYYQLTTTTAPVGGNLTVVNANIAGVLPGGVALPAASGKFYSNTALTVTPTFFKVGATFGSAAGTAQPADSLRDYVDGSILIAPGGILAVTTSATGTTFVVGGSICWEELTVGALS